jgi:hypothetical protein
MNSYNHPGGLLGASCQLQVISFGFTESLAGMAVRQVQ